MNVFKVHCLDAHGALEKIYVFSGETPIHTPLGTNAGGGGDGGGVDGVSSSHNVYPTIPFDGKPSPKYYGIPIIDTNQQIHPDDSIRVIKNKIVKAIGENVISYNELYLFMSVYKRVDMMEVYQYMTNYWRNDFSRDQLIQLLHNLHIAIPKDLSSEKSVYTYDEIINIVGHGIVEPDDIQSHNDKNKYVVSIPVGQKFPKYHDFTFSVNPYRIGSHPLYNPAKSNTLTVFDNMLLLNYGSPVDNIIYVCLAENVLTYNQSVIPDDGLDAVVIQSYFPFLFLNDRVATLEQLHAKKETILKTAKTKIDKHAFELYKTIDLFYDIYHKRRSDLTYIDRGIQSYSVMLDTNLRARLPLEIIFKNIHATETIPFIKYNPGSMRENIYRLFVDKISKNGKKIPKLSEQEILRLARKLGKGNQISLYVAMRDIMEEIYIDFLDNGNIHVYGDLSKPLLPSELSEMIRSSVNPVINNINVFLQKSGYKIPMFIDLYHDTVKVLNMKYIAKMMIEKELTHLQQYIKCLSSLFVIYQPNISKVAKMVFKRVENFKEMDAKMLYIQTLYKQTDNAEIIIKNIMENFQVSNEDAKQILGKYLETITQDNSNEVIDVPGFQTMMYNDKEENHIVIEVDNIINIEYIRILHMYIDSFLRMTQHSTTTDVLKMDIDAICKTAAKMKVGVDKTHIQNNVVVAPIVFAPILNVEKYITDGNDDIGSTQKVRQLDDTDGNEDDDLFKDAKAPEPGDYDDDDDDDALFYGEEDEEEADDLFKGGGRKKKVQNIITNDILLNDLLDENEEKLVQKEGEKTGEPYRVGWDGVSMHNPNIFERRMQKREPFLFTTKSGKFTNYSTLCQSAAKKQPIILTDEEKTRIDENDAKYGKGSKSYQHAIRYGTTPNKKYWYICPRYWCLQTNMSMTEEEVRAGKCGTNPYPHNIIPDDAEVVPNGAYVIEFKSKKHIKADGRYNDHNPAVLTKKTADGHCLPCCYSGWRSGLWNKHMETCAEAEPDDADEPTDKDGVPLNTKATRPLKTNKPENYIVGIDKINIGPGRWGLLPFSVQAFFHEDNNKCIAKTEDNQKNKTPFNTEDICLLRYGVESLVRQGSENNEVQSFLGCVAVMYAYKHDLEKTPTIREMKQILVDTLTLDHFVQSYNGSLLSTFKPARIDIGEIDYNNPAIINSGFYKNIDLNNENQFNLLNDTIAAFENFQKYLADETIEIDHTYLWDIVCEPDDKLMKGGFNLVILEMPKDDIRDNIQIVCPTHSKNNVLYDPAKETIILLRQSNKHGTFYELICGYAKDNNVIKAFSDFNTPDNVKYVLNIIQKTTNKYCAPLPGLPKQYNFKKNITAMEIGKILKPLKYTILHEVLNYQGKVVGLIISSTRATLSGDMSEYPVGTYIPTYPSAASVDISHKWMDDDAMWSDYETTRDSLISLHTETRGKILCHPEMKVLDDGMIVGIITETNQFVPISPISENIFDDGIISVDSHNYLAKEGEDLLYMDNINNISYLAADTAITTSQTGDLIRQSIVSKIDLETRYYTYFRSVIRNLLSEYENRNIRKEITGILDNIHLTYKEKLTNITIALRDDLVGNRIEFADIDDDILEDIEKQCMNMSGTGDMVCFTDTGSGKIMIPKTHLLGSSVSNSKIYYARMADELIRNTRIKLFMLSSSNYLTIGNSEYVIYDNELLLLQSLLNADYFKDIVGFNTNKYLKNIDYQNAVPMFSQKYTNNPITVAEQRKLEETPDIELPNTLNMDYVKEKLKNVQGHPTTSLWGRLFYNTAEEYRFYATGRSSFYMLSFICNNILTDRQKPAVQITTENMKDLLLQGYSKYFEFPGYKAKIMAVLSSQGKTKLFKGNATFEQVVKSEGYYVSDLDIWVLANILSLPIVLFASTSLKSLFYDKIDWLIMGGNPQKDIYYFIRSPTKIAEMEYQLILPGVRFTAPHMNRFYSIYQSMAIATAGSPSPLHIQTLKEYLDAYKIGPKKMNA